MRPTRQPTLSVQLPGGQERLRQMILYVSKRCENANFFGKIKLNKILWKADFDAFRQRGVPVTGREYRRQKFGPVPYEMPPVYSEMLKDGLIRVEPRDFGDDIVEQRTIALAAPRIDELFAAEDIGFVDRAIAHYWEMTGTEASDQSHGTAWATRANGETMPYESSLLSDREPNADQLSRLRTLIKRRELTSQ